MKTTFIILLAFLTAGDSLSQDIAGSYKQFGDSTEFSELELYPNQAFLYKHYEMSCRMWYSVSGQWKRKADSLFLFDSTVIEDLTTSIDTSENLNNDFVSIKIVDNNGKPLKGIRVSYNAIGIRDLVYYSNADGRLTIPQLKTPEISDTNLIDFRAISIDNTNSSDDVWPYTFYIHKRFNDLILTINENPLIYRLERLTTYVVKNEKLLWVDQRYIKNSDPGNFWGNFVRSKE